MTDKKSMTDKIINECENNKIRIYIRTFGGARMPVYASENSAGCDLFATEDMVIWPGETKLMPLGIIIAAPPGVEAQIRPRSGLSLRTSLRVPNSPGTVDSDYRDPVAVILHNTFNMSDLPFFVAGKPELLKELLEKYTCITTGELLKRKTGQEGAAGVAEAGAEADAGAVAGEDIGAASGAEAETRPETGTGVAMGSLTDGVSSVLLQEIFNRKIFIDSNGNPYGSIYIKKGDRIAQMVFCRHLGAEFILHPDPGSVGNDRGGGFGHTGA
ncbi:MAG: aminotransferase [Eubacteriales bacterium]|nr:aminotransferase [Eubacteriales bacterium]